MRTSFSNFKLQIIRLGQGQWSCTPTHYNSYFYSYTYEKTYLAVHFTRVFLCGLVFFSCAFSAKACVHVFTSIHREGFICLDQLGNQGTNQRCYVEDVNFLSQAPSSLLYNAAPNLSN